MFSGHKGYRSLESQQTKKERTSSSEKVNQMTRCESDEGYSSSMWPNVADSSRSMETFCQGILFSKGGERSLDIGVMNSEDDGGNSEANMGYQYEDSRQKNTSDQLSSLNGLGETDISNLMINCDNRDGEMDKEQAIQHFPLERKGFERSTKQSDDTDLFCNKVKDTRNHESLGSGDYAETTNQRMERTLKQSSSLSLVNQETENQERICTFRDCEADMTEAEAKPDEDEQVSFKEGIRRNRVLLMETLDIGLFEHLLPKYLQYSIEKGSGNKTKLREILDLLARSPEEWNQEFVKIWSGIYPETFKEVAGRPPTEQESDYCVSELSSHLAAAILTEGHKPDLLMDERISLDDQFVQLLLVSETESSNMSADNLPDEYEAFLNNTSSNTTYQDILSSSPNNLVLLRGRAGIGKTTLVQCLLKEWANKRWAETKTCVFMLNLRYLLVHDYRISLSDLLTMCSLYRPGGSHPQLKLWMENCQERLMFFLDGIDEIPELQLLIKNTRKITNLDEEATCLEWCINILRRDVLHGAAKIVSSRPFTGIYHLNPDHTIEVLGLTEERVNEFIEKNVTEEKRRNVHTFLSLNPMLKSVCSITFYASMLCRVLQEETEAVRLNISTYSQITAFVILKAGTRHKGGLANPGPMGMAQDLADVLPLLARLARRGLQMDSDNPRLIFDQEDITRAGISRSQQIALERMNLINFNVVKHKNGEECYAELVHLSIQEILAMADLLQNDSKGLSETISKMSKTGRFNMAQLFLIGIGLDSSNEWIDAFNWAAGYRREERESSTSGSSSRGIRGALKKKTPEEEIVHFLQEKIKDQGQLLQGLQAAYEAQAEDIAKMVARKIVKKDKIAIQDMNMTAVDVSAFAFVMKHVEGLRVLKLQQVTLDRYAFDLLADFLVASEGIEVLQLIDKELKVDDILRWLVPLSRRQTSLNIQVPSIVPKKVSTTSNLQWVLEDVTRLKRCMEFSLLDSGVTENGAFHLSQMMNMEDSSIQTLNLAYNPINDEGAEHLSTALKDNKTLLTLKLNNTNISDEGAICLSAALEENTTLERLNLENCLMTNNGLLSLLACKHQEMIDIRVSSTNSTLNQDLIKVSRDGRRLNEIKELRLDNSGITDRGAFHLSQVLMLKECRIGTLDLSSNLLTSEGVQHLSAALPGTTSLTVLNLSHNLIDDEGAKLLSSTLKQNTTLQILNLSHNLIDDEGAKLLSPVLKQNTTVQILNLEANPMTDHGIEVLSHALQRNTGLKFLNFEDTMMTYNGLLALVDSICKRQEVIEIKVSDLEFRLNKDLIRILTLADAMSELKELRLSHSEISDTGAFHLAEVLKLDTCELEAISLRNNQITNEGVKYLSAALQDNTSLHSLDLSNNDIDSEGVRHLSEALHRNTALTSLSLSMNEIGGEGAKHLSKALGLNSTLKSLYLLASEIDNEGAKHLSTAMKHNTNLTILNLCYNEISDEGAKILAEGLRCNSTLKELNLRWNTLSKAGKKFLLGSKSSSLKIEVQ